MPKVTANGAGCERRLADLPADGLRGPFPDERVTLTFRLDPTSDLSVRQIALEPSCVLCVKYPYASQDGDLNEHRGGVRQYKANVRPRPPSGGRPLTPVSVAGVARRTSRRCAAGVYNC